MFTPYMHFQGCCAEALTTYCRVLGGTELTLMTYDDVPDGGFGGAGAGQLIMHGSFRLRDGMLFASDFPPGMEGERQQAVSVHLDFPTDAAAHAAFDALREGGQEIMPFAETFWATGFGMLRDRFGTHWMLSGPMKAG
ncbi:VOC family protein [Paenirhodobacter sp.]|jgi:PhnB protein|uniref:VOC family protein n=1 Tax=Paenirhodobacter sp. TaxID=1965326 RepID=UPI003B50B75E